MANKTCKDCGTRNLEKAKKCRYCDSSFEKKK